MKYTQSYNARFHKEIERERHKGKKLKEIYDGFPEGQQPEYKNYNSFRQSHATYKRKFSER